MDVTQNADGSFTLTVGEWTFGPHDCVEDCIVRFGHKVESAVYEQSVARGVYEPEAHDKRAGFYRQELGWTGRMTDEQRKLAELLAVRCERMAELAREILGLDRLFTQAGDDT